MRLRNYRTSGGAFYRLPITHRTNPAIAGTVIHPHVCHVTTCNLKADIRGSDQSAVHVLPRTPSISSAWRGCGACPPFAYRKTRLILWQCVCARFGRIFLLFADMLNRFQLFLINFSFFLSINLFTRSRYVISCPCEISANVNGHQTETHR